MEIRELRAVVAVAEERSISRGARRLHITQQSLSATVTGVERRLGVRLFARTSRGVEPTAAGRALLDHAPAVLGALDAAVAAARAAGDAGGALTLRHGLDTEPFVEPFLAAFRAAHPAITVSGWSGNDTDNLAALRAGAVDAVFAWALDGGHDGLRTAPVDAERTLLALRAGHPLARHDAVPVAGLAGETLVLFPRASAPAVWDHLVRALRPSGGAVIEVAASGQGVMVDAVAHGQGVCPVSARLANRLRRADVVLRPLDPPVSTPLHLAWRGTPAPPLAALLALAAGPPGRLAP